MSGRKYNLQRSAANTPATVSRYTSVRSKIDPVYLEENQPARFMVQTAKPHGTRFRENTSLLPRRLNTTVVEPRVEVEQMQRQVFERRQRYSYPVGENNDGCTSTRIPIRPSSQRQRILPPNRSDPRLANEELERSFDRSDLEDITPPPGFYDASRISIPSSPESRARLCSRIKALLSDIDTPGQRNEEGRASGNRIDFINDRLHETGGTYDRFTDEESSELPRRFKSSTIPSGVDFENIECPPEEIKPLQSRTSNSMSTERSFTIPRESSSKQDDEDDFTDINDDNELEVKGSTQSTESMDRQTGNNLGQDELDDIEIPTVPSIEDLGRETPLGKFTQSARGFAPLEHSRRTIRDIRDNLKVIIENLSMVYDQLAELNFYNRAAEVEINDLRGKLEKVLPSYDDDTLFP